jgi:hypothetical protein
MFSSWIVREVAGLRAVSTNMHPPKVACTERTKAASITVIFYIFWGKKKLANMTLQMIIAAKNNIIAISFFKNKNSNMK